MNKIFTLASLLVFMLLGACGNNNNNETDNNLDPKERDAVRHVRNHLKKGEKLTGFEIVEGPMPAEMMTDKYKGYRDKVNKEGLDYINCVKRGLEKQAFEKQDKIREYQDEIQNSVAQWRQEQGTSKFMFVLGEVSNLSKNQQYRLIAVFNPVTMQTDFFMPVTKPFVNNAEMILSAMEGKLFDYATDPDHDVKTLIKETTDPIVKFIIDTDNPL